MPTFITDLITINQERTDADVEGRTWFELDPDTAYPWTLDRIAEALAGGAVSATLRDTLLPRARALPTEAWALAATPRDELEVEAPEVLRLRAEALEIVRLWATELHHGAVGHIPRGVHIVKRPAWRD